VEELQWGGTVPDMTLQAQRWGPLDCLVGRVGMKVQREGRWTIRLAGINTAVMLKAYRSDARCCVSAATMVPPLESFLLLLEPG